MSMNCVMNVCCDSPCTQPNHTCDLPGREGHCVPITSAPAPALSDRVLAFAIALLAGVAGFALRRAYRSR
jgi:hypothetical protein